MSSRQDSPKVAEAAIHSAGKVIARALRHRAEQIERGEVGNVQTQTPNQIAEEALHAALPHIFSALGSDEAVEAGAKALIGWGAESEEGCELVAKEVLKAVIEQVGGAE